MRPAASFQLAFDFVELTFCLVGCAGFQEFSWK
jgi:hypothetical protein